MRQSDQRVFEALSSVKAGIAMYLPQQMRQEICHCCFRTAEGLFLEVWRNEDGGLVSLRIWSPWGGVPLGCMSVDAWSHIEHIVFCLVGGEEPDFYRPREDALLYPIRRSHLPPPRLLSTREAMENEREIRQRAAEWEELRAQHRAKERRCA